MREVNRSRKFYRSVALLAVSGVAVTLVSCDAEEVAAKVLGVSVDEEMHNDAFTPDTPEPEPAPAPSVADMPSPVAEEPAPAAAPEPAPAADMDYAPESLTGKRLLCSYLDAEMSSRSEEDGRDFSAYAPIADNGKGLFSTDVGDIPMVRRLAVFTARTPDSAPQLLKYSRTGKNTAEVRIYALMIPDAVAALAISNVVSSIDYLTEAQISEKIGQYFLDSSDTLKLTFTGENTATAEGEFSSGTVENKMRGIFVRIEPGNSDAVQPETEAADSGASTNTYSDADSGSSGERSATDGRASLDPLIARMAALRCRYASSARYQKHLLTLLPMIRNGADVDITLPETKGNTALHYACAIGSLGITTWLLEHGANPNAVTDNGSTPLMCVGSDNRAAITQALLNHGARQPQPSYQSTPSYGGDRASLDPLIARMAALRCRYSSSALYQKRLLTLLPMIRNGAHVDITLPETKGNTALHYACAIGSLSITKWLLEHGANPNAVTDKGATPLMCVGSDNRAAITQALLNHGARQPQPSYQSTSSYGGDRSSLDPLIARMAALRCRHSSSALYQKRLLTLLPMIRNGAHVDITLPETKGNTALHYACAIGSLSITKWLLAHGANPNAVTNKGATPLMCVGSDNRAAIIQALRAHGAVR